MQITKIMSTTAGAVNTRPACDPATFLRTIQPRPLPGETLEARFISPKGQHPHRRFYGTVHDLIADVARYRADRHCYFGIAVRRGSNGKADGISRAGCAWTEADEKLWDSEPDPQAAALAAVAGFSLRPTALVATGGGFHLYWALAKPLDVQAPGARERLEIVNAALGRAIAGPGRKPDNVHDVARIFRLPGTLNHKLEYGTPRPVVVVWSEPERRYSLDDLAAVLSARYSWALQAPSKPVERPTCDLSRSGVPADLRERAALGRIRRPTLALLDITGPAGYQSASEADAAVAAALVGAGLTEAETLSLLLSSARGRDAARRKGRHAESYWRRTVAHASSYVGPVFDRGDGWRVRQIPLPQRPRGVPVPQPERPRGVPVPTCLPGVPA